MATMTAVKTKEDDSHSTNEIEFDSEQLRGAIRFVLTAMKQGELPNLDESSYGMLVSPAKGGAKKSRDKVVRKVLGHVVDHLLLEKTAEPVDEKAAKKRRKQLTKTLETTSLDMVNSLIHMESAKLKLEENEVDQPDASPVDEAAKEPDSTTNQEVPLPSEKGRKPKKAAQQETANPNHADANGETNGEENDGDANNPANVLEDDLALDPEKNLAYMNAKAEFERERDEVMSSIPEEVRRCFRRLAFAKWGKEILPGIELGPYDVAPGNVREQWMNMFHNTRKSGRPMTRLIYWYGLDDLSESFSFLPATRVTGYEKGVEKGFDKISPKLQKRIDAGKELTKPEKSLVHALNQIKHEAQLKPEDRVSWVKQVGEDYEYVVEDQAAQFEGAAVAEVPTPDVADAKEQKPKKRASTASKPRKRKKKDVEADPKEEGGNEEDRKEEAPQTEQKQPDPNEEPTNTKKKKRRKKKEAPETESEVVPDKDAQGQPADVASDPDHVPETATKENVPKKKKKKKGEGQDTVDPPNVMQPTPSVTLTADDMKAEEKAEKPKKTLKRKREKRSSAAPLPSAVPVSGDVTMREANGDAVTSEVAHGDAPAKQLLEDTADAPANREPPQDETNRSEADVSKDSKLPEDASVAQHEDGAIPASESPTAALETADDDFAEVGEEEVKSDSDKADEDFDAEENEDDGKDDEDFALEAGHRAKRRRSSGGSRSSTSKATKKVVDDAVAENGEDTATTDAAKRKKKKKDMSEEEKEEDRQQRLAKRRASYQEKAEKKRAEKLAEMDEATAKAEKEAKALAKAYREEQRKLEDCERVLLPIMAKLRLAIDDKDSGSVPQCIADLNGKIGLITPSFVRGHSLGILIKELRQTFEADNVDIGAQCRSLTSEMKRIFKEKENEVPSGFQPKLNKSSPKPKKSDEGEKPVKIKPERSTSLDRIPNRRESETSLKPESADKASVPPVAGKAKQAPTSTPAGRDSTAPTVKKEATATQTPKTPRNFSLRKMFERPEKPKEQESATPRNRVPQSERKLVPKVQLPSWLSGSDGSTPMPDDLERVFAVHFLQDAVALLPSDQVNPSAAARALELVLYQFYKKALEGRASVLYWERVHGIAAAIVGRNGEGQLAKRLLKGEFANPRDVLKLDETALNRMFAT